MSYPAKYWTSIFCEKLFHAFLKAGKRNATSTLKPLGEIASCQCVLFQMIEGLTLLSYSFGNKDLYLLRKSLFFTSHMLLLLFLMLKLFDFKIYWSWFLNILSNYGSCWLHGELLISQYIRSSLISPLLHFLNNADLRSFSMRFLCSLMSHTEDSFFL